MFVETGCKTVWRRYKKDGLALQGANDPYCLYTKMNILVESDLNVFCHDYLLQQLLTL